jgi:maltose-binding protein MalE
MKKSMLFAILIMLSIIFINACSAADESDSHDSDFLTDETQETGAHIEETWVDDDVQIIGLPVGGYTYVRSIIPLEHGINNISVITAINEAVYGTAEIWSEDVTDAKVLFFSINLDTKDVFFYPSSTNLTGGGNNVRSISANSDGEIIYVNHRFLFNVETQTTEEVLQLTQIDTLGNIGFSADITGYFELLGRDGRGTLPHAIVLDDLGNIYIAAENGSILKFDSIGVYQFSVLHPEGAWTQATGTPFQGIDGDMLFPIWDAIEGNTLYSIDNATHSLISRHKVPDFPEVHAFIPGFHGNELFLITDAGVYRYCLELGEQSRVFHWLEVDTPPSIVTPAGEGRFALLHFSNGIFSDTVAVLTRTAVQDDARTIVTMASLSPNNRLVHEFNSQSTEYRIVVLDYSNDDLSVALTRFNIDMIAGRIPDIIDFNYLDFHSLASSGFLANLNKWFEHDNHISRTDFHERVFELLEVEGNLYAALPAFMIATYLAPARLVGTEPGITLERLKQLDEQFNDGNSLLQSEFSRSFIDMHTMVNRRALIDFDMGVARFDTNEFIQVLEYASRLGDNEVIAPIYEQFPFESSIRHGNDHLSFSMIHHLDQLFQSEFFAGTEITPIGFPVDDGVGSLMLPVSLFGIGEGAQNPSGAWAFLRFLLTDMQNEMLGGIPVSQTFFDEWVNHSMNPPQIVDSPHVTHGLYIGGVFVEPVPATQDQANRTLRMIESLGSVLTGGEEVVVNIVAEEVNSFFLGHRSAEEAARIIQSRVQIYVWERTH